MAIDHVLLLFIDGLGLGPEDPSTNPLAASGLTLGSGLRLAGVDRPVFSNSNALVPTDACLGIEGLPQSATGQTSLLTGSNAPALLGRHLSAYPNQALADLLRRQGIFTRCQSLGLKSTFANGYSRQYWRLVSEGRRRHSATTLAVMGGGIRFRGEEDFERGEALYHDITGHWLCRMGRSVPALLLKDAARRLATITQQNHFTLFEHFILDVFGHRRHWEDVLAALHDLDQFISSLLSLLDLEKTAVILTSDHGNVENLSVAQHSTNPVPTIFYGPAAVSQAASVHSLTDLVPTILSLLTTRTETQD